MGLKTNYKDPVKRFELAERMVWAKLADWEKDEIKKARQTPTTDLQSFKELRSHNRTLDKYNKSIIELAESEAELDDTCPPVPTFSPFKAVGAEDENEVEAEI